MDKLTRKMVNHRKWFEGLKFWPATKEFIFTAAEIPAFKGINPEYGTCPMTTKITVQDKNSVIIFSDISPWCNMDIPGIPKEYFMLLNIYTLAAYPEYKHKKWQQLMMDFCFSFPDFSPPDKIVFAKNPVFDLNKKGVLKNARN